MLSQDELSIPQLSQDHPFGDRLEGPSWEGSYSASVGFKPLVQLPEDELVRQAVLHQYHLLDTLPEKAFDDLTKVAAQICGTPIALINLVSQDRQWFKARLGIGFQQASREQGFCSYAILNPDQVLVVPDALQDSRFSRSEWVNGEVNIRFYAGAPLVNAEGFPLGTLCVMDHQPRQLSVEQLESLQALSRQVIAQMELRLNLQKLEQQIKQREKVETRLRLEKQKVENLLGNILPKPIADQLKQNPGLIAEGFDEVSILFADLVNFTELSRCLSPRELVFLLNQLFSSFDLLAAEYGLEKIKTAGDGYMVAGGLPTPHPNHASAIADMALAMQETIAQYNLEESQSLSLRIGINTGPVVAGVIGMTKFTYDLWGDAVNVASRMESHGIGGKIQITESTYRYLKNRYRLEHRGEIPIKGQGPMKTYWLLGKDNL